MSAAGHWIERNVAVGRMTEGLGVSSVQPVGPARPEDEPSTHGTPVPSPAVPLVPCGALADARTAGIGAFDADGTGMTGRDEDRVGGDRTGFTASDIDGGGTVSEDERDGASFAGHDVDGDGVIGRDEHLAFEEDRAALSDRPQAGRPSWREPSTYGDASAPPSAPFRTDGSNRRYCMKKTDWPGTTISERSFAGHRTYPGR